MMEELDNSGPLPGCGTEETLEDGDDQRSEPSGWDMPMFPISEYLAEKTLGGSDVTSATLSVVDSQPSLTPAPDNPLQLITPGISIDADLSVPDWLLSPFALEAPSNPSPQDLIEARDGGRSATVTRYVTLYTI